MAPATERLRHLLVAEQQGTQPLRSRANAVLDVAAPIPLFELNPPDRAGSRVNPPATAAADGIRMRASRIGRGNRKEEPVTELSRERPSSARPRGRREPGFDTNGGGAGPF